MTSIVSLSTSPRHVQMELFPPSSGDTTGGTSVVVAYGTEGLLDPFGDLIRGFCQRVADEGMTVVLPHFFEISATQPGLKTVASALNNTNIRLWTDALTAAVSWCRTDRQAAKVALVGFSLGANLAAHAARATPVEGYVDFFGPMRTFGLMPFPSAAAMTPAMAADLPDTQIHHGTLDLIVDQSESHELASWLAAAGVSCEFHNDYHCGHPGQPELAWTKDAQKSATTRTISFLNKHVATVRAGRTGAL